MDLDEGSLKQTIADQLGAVRRRSLALLDPLPESDLLRQHSPIMSPLVWDLAHVGNYEEIWLLDAVAGMRAGPRNYDDLYDAFRHSRAERLALPLLGPAEARTYIAGVRGKALEVLERVEFDPDHRLLGGAYVYGMVVQHEHQHDETMLATLQLMDGDGYRPQAPVPPRGRKMTTTEVLVEGGPFVMGSSLEPWAYDNERPAHTVELAPFFIDVTPVTNRDYLAFVEAGGYDDPRWWTPQGWAYRQRAGLVAPQFWRKECEGVWSRLRFGWREDLPPNEPVCHVCWFEADAYARWAGKRLPAEAEWEKAASVEPTGAKRRYPWGDAAPTPDLANLGQRHFRPAAAGAYPQGVSPWGCEQMIGDVWEWTSSAFRPYPGYTAFPYKEYSAVFFERGDDFKVLRGGSWATDPTAVRATFRNWDYPIRRQIFAGFRCARDA
ncbi:MAG TPA: ergothioneine biosynthesis protein EgtB [Actinomycetota bacterium]|nr:ergothioneine biosynthesis protein EgtB [Actinomycetota bacterium]